MKKVGNRIVIGGFIDSVDRDSNWSLQLIDGNSPDAIIVGMFWGEKEIATHRVIVSRGELIALLGGDS